MAQGTSQEKDEDRAFSPAAKLDNLTDEQKEEVKSQSRPNATLIHETIRAEGESELERTAWALILSGLAAGLSMGFSLVVQGELHANLPAGPARVLLSPLGYTIGFLIVVLGRQQLFTENTLTPILPLLHNRDLSTLGRVARLGAATFLTVAQHGVIGDMRAPVDVTYLADTVVLLRYFEAFRRVHRAISMLKRRTGSHDNSIREFTIGRNGISVGPVLEKFHGILRGVPEYVGESISGLPETGS